ncbi:putative polyol transporter 6 [Mycena alexandri]|uniref:Polyol transporter 6 n=1 Tax=Mycena alexandri TaxID=1745969 RepID=A0AAD6SZ62_9AGAR|nr:putative polyol transporter 6 [Mycena alexandri]
MPEQLNRAKVKLRTANAKLANPLRGVSREQLIRDAERFAEEKELKHLSAELQKGALVAQDPEGYFESIDLLSEDDEYHLRRETTHRYHQTGALYYPGFSRIASLLSSFGFGLINFLLLRHIWATKEQLAGVSLGICSSSFRGLFAPFTYSAEAFPLYIRDIGMSFATATSGCWFFNIVLLNSVLWVLILLFVRETKGRTLEKLDQVFSVPMRDHAAYGLRQMPYGIRKFVLRQNVTAERLYEADDDSLDGAELVRREKAEGKAGNVIA